MCIEDLTSLITSDAASRPPSPNANPPASATIATAPINRMLIISELKPITFNEISTVKIIRVIRARFARKPADLTFNTAVDPLIIFFVKF